MELLNDLPTVDAYGRVVGQTNASKPGSDTRKTKRSALSVSMLTAGSSSSTSDDSSDSESMASSTEERRGVRPPKKRSKQNVSIDRGGSASALTRSSSGFGSHLGLNIGQDTFEVKSISRKKLPKADGTEWTTRENLNEKNRPYGRNYIDDQKQRLELLYADPNYRFISDLAGALSKEVFELFSEDDMETALRERETERLQTQIDLQRTLVTMREKNGLIRNLQDLLRQITETRNALKRRLRDQELWRVSKYLIDDEEQKSVAGTEKSSVGFYALQKLIDLYVRAFDVIDTESDGIVARYLQSKEEEGYLELKTDEENTTSETKEFIYDLVLYHQSMMDNDISAQRLLRADIARHIALIYEHPYRENTDITDDELRELDGPLDSVFQPKGTLFDNTETIDLAAFDALKIPKATERLMLEWACEKQYGTAHPNYCSRVVPFIYGDETVLEGPSGLNLRSDATRDPQHGHPREISTLIQLLIKDLFDRELDAGGMNLQRGIIRAHLLWIYFAKRPFSDIAALLGGHRARIKGTIERTFRPLGGVLRKLNDYYQLIIVHYLRMVELFFIEDNPVLTFPFVVASAFEGRPDGDTRTTTASSTRRRGIFDQAQGQGQGQQQQQEEMDDLTPSYRGIVWSRDYEGKLFLQLNKMFGDLVLTDIVTDKAFLYYLTQGKHWFVSEIEEDEEDDDDLAEQVATVEPTKLVAGSYPVLQLHQLYRAYVRFVDTHLVFLEKKRAAVTRAIDQATLKLSKVVGQEKMDSSKKHLKSAYVQRKTFVMQPINSGLVKLRPLVVTMIQRAYFYVQRFCPGLRRLPLEAFHHEAGYQVGLTAAFIEFIAALVSYNDLDFPDNYKSSMQYKHISKKLHDTMASLKHFGYSGCNPHYKIYMSGNPISGDSVQNPFGDWEPLQTFNGQRMAPAPPGPWTGRGGGGGGGGIGGGGGYYNNNNGPVILMF